MDNEKKQELHDGMVTSGGSDIESKSVAYFSHRIIVSRLEIESQEIVITITIYRTNLGQREVESWGR